MKTFFLLISFLISFPVFSQVKYIGHRGASYLAPENTLASVNLAWKLDADAAEIDVFLSKDNRVIVSHDSSTKRICGVNCKIRETTSGELRKLDAGSWKDSRFAGEKLPFVEEVIATIPEGKTLVIEIKGTSEVLPFLKKAVDESGKGSRIDFIAFDWETILQAKKTFPDNACYWLSSKKNDLTKRMKQAAKLGLDGVDLQSKVIDREVMELARKLNLNVLAWTVDKPAEARRIADLGVEGITTNRPAWLKEQLEQSVR